LAEHFRIIWRGRWQVLAAALVIAAATFAWRSTRPSVYQATAQISVESGRAIAGLSASERDTVFLARNYAELARTLPVVADATRRSGLSISPIDARDLITLNVASDVGFVTVAAEGPSEQAATALAGATADALIDATITQQAETLRRSLDPVEQEIRELEARLGQLPASSADRDTLAIRYDALVMAATERRLAPTDRLALVAPARAEVGRVSPAPVREALLAFLVALVVNAELVAVGYSLKDRFSDEEQDVGADQVAGLPVLGRVPARGHEATLEAFRTLRTNLMFMNTNGGVRTVAVVSAHPGTGKTHTSIHLAQLVAALDVPVVLIDADMRRPNVHIRLGANLSPGLGDLLSGAPLERVLTTSPELGQLHVVTGGTPVEDPAGGLATRDFSEMLDRLKWAAIVIVDTPPLALFSDALPIASRCDATILVVDARTTRRQTVRAAVQQLRRVDANIIGLVLNRTERVAGAAEYQHYRREPGNK